MLLAFEVDGYKVFDERIKFDMNANMRFRKLKENMQTINSCKLDSSATI